MRAKRGRLPLPQPSLSLNPPFRSVLLDYPTDAKSSKFLFEVTWAFFLEGALYVTMCWYWPSSVVSCSLSPSYKCNNQMWGFVNVQPLWAFWTCDFEMGCRSKRKRNKLASSVDAIAISKSWNYQSLTDYRYHYHWLSHLKRKMSWMQGALARRVIGEERGAFHTRRAQSRCFSYIFFLVVILGWFNGCFRRRKKFPQMSFL